MCYYTAYVFMTCGHVAMSEFPIHNSPCSKRILIRGRCVSRQSNRSASPAETAVPVGNAQVDKSEQGLGETISSEMFNNLSIDSPPVEEEQQSLGTNPVIGSECLERLTHPMHTISLERQCNVCIEDRETRLEAFWQRTQQDINIRLSTRLSSIGSNASGWQGRRFRATGESVSPSLLSRSRSSTNTAVSDMTMESPEVKVTIASPASPRRNSIEHIVDSDSSISTNASTASTASPVSVGHFMRGVVGWKTSDSADGASLFSSPKTNRLSWFGTPISPKSRTPVGQIPDVKVVDIDEVASPRAERVSRPLLSFGGFDA